MNRINALRFLFIFFIVQIIPIDWRFYHDLFSIDAAGINFYHLFSIARYYPRLFGFQGFENWAIAGGLAMIGTVIWNRRYKHVGDFEKLQYWLRVVLRYRLAIGVIAYGLIKFFPLQMPYPSLSNLHTNYGDFLPWKIYYHTLGITPGYEAFLGAVEILAGVLLLYRKTTTFGAGIILGFSGNVFAANFAYDGGEQYYSAFLFLIATVLFLYDLPRLYSLLVQRKFTHANHFKPSFSEKRLRHLRNAGKAAAAFFILVLALSTYANYTTAPYKVPSGAGLPGSYGFYNVKEFRLNNRLIPYSTTDPDRWQNVVFEKWATISIKIARPVEIDRTNGDGYHRNDIDRNFESAGVGGRHYYSYTADSAQSVLQLLNKNKSHEEEFYTLQYSRPNDSTIVVQGINEKNDSIYALLEKIDRKYLLFEGRRKRVKL